MPKEPFVYKFSVEPPRGTRPEDVAKRVLKEMNRVLGLVSRTEADSDRDWRFNADGYLILTGDPDEIQSTPVFLKTVQEHNTRIRANRTR